MGTTNDSAKENRLYSIRWSGLHVCVPFAINSIPRDTLTHTRLLKHLCGYHPSDRFRRPVQLWRRHVRLLQSLDNHCARARTRHPGRLSAHVPARL